MEEPRLELVLRWTKSRPLVLMGVDLKRGKDAWQPLLPKPVAENDGELAVDLGSQEPGALRIKFAVVALAEIPRIAAYAVTDGGGAEKVAPSDPDTFKRMKRYDRWLQEARYDVAAPVV